MTGEMGMTKWKCVPAHIAEGPSEVRHPDGWLLCTTPSDESAAFITEACNVAHETGKTPMELVDALKARRLHASGDLLATVREWWSRSGMKSTIREVLVQGNGGVRVEWNDSEESGSYHISAEELYGTRAFAGRVKVLEGLVYVPGLHKCAKCGCSTMSTLIHAHTGKFAANNEPQQCPNACGPMWPVTERQAGNDLVDRAEKLSDRVKELEGALRFGESAAEELCQGQHPENECWNVLAQIRAALSGGA